MSVGRDEHRSAEEIRRDIDRTRVGLNRTLEELEDRLDPRHVMEFAMGTLKDTLQAVKDAVVDTARDHPISTAVAAGGLGLLAAIVIRDRMTDHERSRLQRLKRRAEDVAESARDRLADWTSETRRRASDIADRAEDAASSFESRASRGVHHAVEKAEDAYRAHPFAIGLAAVGAGVGAGLAMPSTRVEDRWCGEHRDALLRRAKEGGREVLHGGERVVEAAARTAREEAQRQHVTPHDLKEEFEEEARDTGRDLRRRAAEVAEAAKESARAEAERQNLPAPGSSASQQTDSSRSGDGRDRST